MFRDPVSGVVPNLQQKALKKTCSLEQKPTEEHIHMSYFVIRLFLAQGVDVGVNLIHGCCTPVSLFALSFQTQRNTTQQSTRTTRRTYVATRSPMGILVYFRIDL